MLFVIKKTVMYLRQIHVERLYVQNFIYKKNMMFQKIHVALRVSLEFFTVEML